MWYTTIKTISKIFAERKATMNKKILTSILALLIVVPMLFACSSNKKNNDSTETTQGNTSVEFPEIDKYIDELAAQYKYDGITFDYICRSDAAPENEEETGNLENDAMYKRQRELEDKFGIDFLNYACTGDDYGGSPTSEVADKVYTDVLSGLSTYDLIQGNFNAGGLTMLQNGCLQYVEELDILDFDRSWWMNDMVDQFSIAGHLYFMTGKIVPNHYTDPWCILYNKEIAENYNMEDLYEIVKAGNWTLDKMFEVASVIPANSDVYRTKIYYYNSASSFFFSGGFEICDFDEEGNPFISTSLDPDAVDYVHKLAELLGDSSTCYVTDMIGDNNEAEDDMFANGETFYEPQQMGSVAPLREKDVELGILPMPKSSAEQKEYISYVGSGYNAAVYFAKSVQDIEMTCVITEAMAALSEKHLEPAFYEKSLKGRSTYDSESRDMLDIIYRTKKVDFADMYGWGGIVESLNKACYGANDSFISGYTSSVRFAGIQIQKLMKQITTEK